MKQATTKRSAFAMIIAIIVIIVISTFMALSLSLTSQGGKRMTDVYLYEQMVLHSHSAAEETLLNIANTGFGGGCVNSFNKTYDTFYDANVTVRYIFANAGANVGGCSNYINNISTPEQNGSVLMDITVSVRSDQNVSTEPMRYFRRTIQKL